MNRFAATVAVALFLNPAWLCAQTTSAQTTVLTVKTPSADIHLSPSMGSVVLGHAPNGTVLTVTRELGSWVRVSWPAAKDGIGYVHVSVGRLGPSVPSEPSRPAGAISAQTPQTALQPASTTAVGVSAERPVTAARPAVAPGYLTPASHVFGLGARMGGPTFSFGGTVRGWIRGHIGTQLDVSHSAFDSVEAAGHVTSIQFAPSLLVSLPDRVTDYVWMRPYVGAGASFGRQTLNTTALDDGPSVSESKVGYQVFGGTELMFASVPQFALSLDVGYHNAPTSFTGVELGGPVASVSVHWYLK